VGQDGTWGKTGQSNILHHEAPSTGVPASIYLFTVGMILVCVDSCYKTSEIFKE